MSDIFDMVDSWNNITQEFYAIKMNVTDTVSAATSKLLDLQVNGTSKFNVGKDGTVSMTGYLIQHPPAAIVPTNNGELAIEATNNTTLTFRFKGTDGVVRSGVLALT